MLQAAASKAARRLFDIKFIPHETPGQRSLGQTRRDARTLYDRL
jgi:hypothetical protein